MNKIKTGRAQGTGKKLNYTLLRKERRMEKNMNILCLLSYVENEKRLYPFIETK